MEQQISMKKNKLIQGSSKKTDRTIFKNIKAVILKILMVLTFLGVFKNTLLIIKTNASIV
jgi:hypothetical protein